MSTAWLDELLLTLGVIRDYIEYTKAFLRVLYILYNLLRIICTVFVGPSPTNVTR